MYYVKNDVQNSAFFDFVKDLYNKLIDIFRNTMTMSI